MTAPNAAPAGSEEVSRFYSGWSRENLLGQIADLEDAARNRAATMKRLRAERDEARAALARARAEAEAVDIALNRQTFDEWEGLERQQMAAVVASDMRAIVASARRCARNAGGRHAEG